MEVKKSGVSLIYPKNMEVKKSGVSLIIYDLPPFSHSNLSLHPGLKSSFKVSFGSSASWEELFL